MTSIGVVFCVFVLCQVAYQSSHVVIFCVVIGAGVWSTKPWEWAGTTDTIRTNLCFHTSPWETSIKSHRELLGITGTLGPGEE